MIQILKNLTLYFHLCTMISFREALGTGFLCLKSSMLVALWGWSPDANFSLVFSEAFFEAVGKYVFGMRGDEVGM